MITLYKNSMTTFRKNLKFFRRINNLSQSDLGEKLALKRCTIAAYEEGRAEPSVKNFLAMANLFEVEASDLYNKEFQIEMAKITSV